MREKSLHDVRQELLALLGIGAETADAILTYAFRMPFFAQDQNEYQKRYDELVKQYADTKAAYEKTVEQIECMTTRNSLLNSFSKELRKQENILTEFDKGLWGSFVDFMTVHSKEDIDVTFKDGTTIRIE